MIKQKFLLIAALLLFGANVGHAQVSLEIDGHTVVPAGQLTDIRYKPDLRAFVVDSVHRDWRCVANAGPTPGVSPGDFRLVFDSVNPATETDAVYRIAAAALGGSITQDLFGGKIIIQTSANASERLICAPFRESFFSSDFEDLFDLDDSAPAITASGSNLIVPFTVTNRSKSLVATGIEVRFQSEYVPVTTEILGPSFNPIDGSMSLLEPGAWEVDILYPGESASIEVGYDVGAATPDGTLIRTNIDQVSAMNRVGDAALGTDNLTLATTVPVGEAEIALLKTGTLNDDDGTPGVSAGDTISYTFEVTNNSQVTLSNIQLSDPQAVVSGGPIATLAPGVTDAGTFTATYTLSQGDVDAGFFTNLATVTSAEGATAADGDTRTFSGTPGVTLTKLGQLSDDDGTPGLSADDTINYTFEIANTGNVTLSGISVTDPGAIVSGGPIASLAPGTTDTSITGSYTVTQPDIDAGEYQNTATVNSNEGASDTSVHVHTLAGSPAVALTKTGALNDDDGTPGLSAGDTISYTFQIVNVGNLTLTNLSVTDNDPAVSVSGGPVASLAPGGTNSSITGSYEITQGDIDQGEYVNSAAVSSAEGVAASDIHTEALLGQSSLTFGVAGQLQDTDGSGDVTVGDRISYSITLWNTGDITLKNLGVTSSDQAVTISGGPINSLPPGVSDSQTISAFYEITQSDIDDGIYAVIFLAEGDIGDTGTQISSDDLVQTSIP